MNTNIVQKEVIKKIINNDDWGRWIELNEGGELSWFNKYIRSEGDVLNKNVLVIFKIIKLSQNGTNGRINLVCSTIFLDKNNNIDNNNVENIKKLNMIHGEQILYVNVNCEDIEHKFIYQSKDKDGMIIKEIVDKFIFKNKFAVLNIELKDLFCYKKEEDSYKNNFIDLLLKSNKNKYEIVFNFSNVTWYKLVYAFAKNEIFISGGNPSKRHLVSKNDYILSLFLSCLNNNPLKSISNNFNNDLDWISKKTYNNSIWKNIDKNDHLFPIVEVLILAGFQLEMLFFLKRRIFEYLHHYPGCLHYVLSKTFNNDNEIILNSEELEGELTLYVNKNYSSLSSKEKEDLLNTNIIHWYPFLFIKLLDKKNKNEEDEKFLTNYQYLSSLVFVYKDTQKRLFEIKKLIEKIIPKLTDNNITSSKDLKKIVKFNTNIKKYNTLNSNLLTYKFPNLNKTIQTKSFIEFNKNSLSQKKGYHTSSNLNNISISNKEKEKIILPLDKIKDKDLIEFYQDFYNDSLYFRINQILVNDTLNNNVLKQEQIENTLSKFWEKEIINIFKGKNSLFRSGYGIQLLLKTIQTLKNDFEDLKNTKSALRGKIYKDYILELNSENIISIVLSNTIPYCVYNNRFNLVGLYEKVGKEVVKDFFTQEWLNYKNSQVKNNKELALIYNLKETKDKFIFQIKEKYPKLTIEDYFKLGSDLIEFTSSKSNLFKIVNKRNEDKTVNRILIADDGLDDIFIQIFRLDVDNLPMICKPNIWKIETCEIEDTIKNKTLNIIEYGGFLNNKNNKISFIRKNIVNTGNILFTNKDIIETINKLGSIKFSINFNVLNFILNLLNNKNKNILELINIKPHPKTKELYKLAMNYKWAEILVIQKYNNQFYNDRAVLQYAFLFSEWLSKKDNSIYFPYFIDWRGRFYTNVSFFSFQTGELARSLIVFKEGQILNEIGVEALKIYTANCYGLNKLSYNDRINWVELNLNKIINLETDFIFKASEPLLFLATCFELKGYYQDKENFISTLPIYLDATCNGLQHLSSMINDANLAKFVNIVKSSKNDVPNDVYNKMVENVNININSLIENNPEFSKLNLLNVDRTFIKNGIMTIPYGVTTRGISSQLVKEFFILLDPVKDCKRAFILQDKKFLKNQDINLTLTFKEIFKLADIIHNVLYNSFPNLTVVVKYLKDINRFLKSLGLSTVWLTPSGMLIEQRYSKVIKAELVTSILGKRKSITINKIDKNIINLQKQNSGIVPNLVHSLDASNIALLIKKWDTNLKDIDILTIHDCFGCQGNNVQMMVLEIKLAFLSIYGNGNFISSYHKFILEYISKSGFEILDNNTVIVNNDKLITVPKEPNFPENKSFKESILMSQYLFN